MNWNDWAGGLIFGISIGYAICARLNLRRARRTAAEIEEMGRQSDARIAEMRSMVE